MVVRLRKTRRIEPRRARLESLRPRREAHFDLPMGARDVFERRREKAHAAVAIRPREPIDRRRARGRMAYDAEIELYATAAPGAPHGDVAELHDVVVVDEIDSALFVVRAPNLAADVRHHGDADLLVLEDDRLPRLRLALRGGAVVAEVWVALLGDGRHRVGIRERICRHFDDRFGHGRRAIREGTKGKSGNDRCYKDFRMVFHGQ